MVTDSPRTARGIALENGLCVVAARDGYFLINRCDVFIGLAIEIYGEYSGIEQAFLRQLVKPGDNVVEVGANIGSHTVGLAKAITATGCLVAFEPQRPVYALLQSQIALNNLRNVTAYNSAVGKQPGHIWVPTIDYGSPGNFGGVELLPKPLPGLSESVEVVTLDDTLANAPLALIKIDVEGMEEDVLRGGLNVIREHKPVIYAENDRLHKSKSLITLLFELGYRVWWHLPAIYNPGNFYGNQQNYYGTNASCNIYCCHESRQPVDTKQHLTECTSPDTPHPWTPDLASK